MNGVAAVCGVNGARDCGSVLLKIIRSQDALLLIQRGHNCLSYAPLVKPCIHKLLHNPAPQHSTAMTQGGHEVHPRHK